METDGFAEKVEEEQLKLCCSILLNTSKAVEHARLHKVAHKHNLSSIGVPFKKYSNQTKAGEEEKKAGHIQVKGLTVHYV